MTFRPGDRVSPYDNMKLTGTVQNVYLEGSQQLMEGGTMQGLWIVDVKLDMNVNGSYYMRFRADVLRKLDD